VSHSLVQRALDRAGAAGLYLNERRAPHVPNLEEFLRHGLRFVAPAPLGEVVPGMPAAWAAAPMSERIRTGATELPPVWPTANGRVRGQALEPLHRAAIRATSSWQPLASLLAVVDSLRAGDARVRRVASEELGRMLDGARR
jgi:hypothetical protein